MNKKTTVLLLLLATVLIGVGLCFGAAVMSGMYSTPEPPENESISMDYGTRLSCGKPGFLFYKEFSCL